MIELPVIDPPPGGLERLRARIAGDDRRRAKLRWVPVLAIAAAIAVWFAYARPHAPPPVAASTLLPDPSVGVAFYWVAPTTTPPTPRSSPELVDISAVSIAP
ncbi:MAG TPA: hypothetical protein VH143_11135 [Kofleriaceae bacterium]|jgi:hypothetical protein|nr:hypothetical protein [Kofleriaceae bacterium]